MDLDDSKHLKVPRFKAFRDELRAALKQFETFRDWADIDKAVVRLQKCISKYGKDVNTMPEKLWVCKRLGQCLNPLLPSGVLRKVLDTYDLIFQMIGDRLGQDLPIYSSGLFFLFPKKREVQERLLRLFESFYLRLSPMSLSKCLAGFFGCLLPTLAEEGSDIQPRIMGFLRTVQRHFTEAGLARVFFHHLWECIRLSPACRVAGLAFLEKNGRPHLPQSSLKSTDSQLTLDHLGGDPHLAVGALVCCLTAERQDMQLRGALELLNSSFMIHERGALPEDCVVRITKYVLLLFAREELPLYRRIVRWLDGDDRPCPEYFAEHSKPRVGAAFNALLRAATQGLAAPAPRDPTPAHPRDLSLMCVNLMDMMKDRAGVQSMVMCAYAEFIARGVLGPPGAAAADDATRQPDALHKIFEAVSKHLVCDFVSRRLRAAADAAGPLPDGVAAYPDSAEQFTPAAEPADPPPPPPAQLEPELQMIGCLLERYAAAMGSDRDDPRCVLGVLWSGLQLASRLAAASAAARVDPAADTESALLRALLGAVQLLSLLLRLWSDHLRGGPFAARSAGGEPTSLLEQWFCCYLDFALYVFHSRWNLPPEFVCDVSHAEFPARVGTEDAFAPPKPGEPEPAKYATEGEIAAELASTLRRCLETITAHRREVKEDSGDLATHPPYLMPPAASDCREDTLETPARARRGSGTWTPSSLPLTESFSKGPVAASAPPWVVAVFNLCHVGDPRVALPFRQLAIHLATSDPPLLPPELVRWVMQKPRDGVRRVIELLWVSLSVDNAMVYPTCRLLHQVFAKERRWRKVFKAVLNDDVMHPEGKEYHVSSAGYRRFSVMWKVTEELGIVDADMLKEPLALVLDTLRGESLPQRARGLAFLQQASLNIPRCVDPYVSMLFKSAAGTGADEQRLDYALKTLHAVVECAPLLLIRNALHCPVSRALRDSFQKYLEQVGLSSTLTAVPCYFFLLVAICLRTTGKYVAEPATDDWPCLRSALLLRVLLKRGRQVCENDLSSPTSAELASLCGAAMEPLMVYAHKALDARQETLALDLGRVLLIASAHAHEVGRLRPLGRTQSGSQRSVDRSPPRTNNGPTGSSQLPRPSGADPLEHALALSESMVSVREPPPPRPPQPRGRSPSAPPPSTSRDVSPPGGGAHVDPAVHGKICNTLFRALRHAAGDCGTLAVFARWCELLQAFFPLLRGVLPEFTQGIVQTVNEVMITVLRWPQVSLTGLGVMEDVLSLLASLGQFLLQSLARAAPGPVSAQRESSVLNIFGRWGGNDSGGSDSPAGGEQEKMAVDMLCRGVLGTLRTVVNLIVLLGCTEARTTEERSCLELRRASIEQGLRGLLRMLYEAHTANFLYCAAVLWSEQLAEQQWASLLTGELSVRQKALLRALSLISPLTVSLAVCGVYDVIKRTRRVRPAGAAQVLEVCAAHLVEQVLLTAPQEWAARVVHDLPQVLQWARDVTGSAHTGHPLLYPAVLRLMEAAVRVMVAPPVEAAACRRALEDKRNAKDIGDLTAKLIEAVCRSLHADTSHGRAEESSTIALVLVTRCISNQATVQRTLGLLFPTDQQNALFVWLHQQWLAGVLRHGDDREDRKCMEMRRMQIRKVHHTLLFLTEVARQLPLAGRSLRDPLLAHVNDLQFFHVDPRTLAQWRALLMLVSHTDKDVKDMLESHLRGITLPSTVNVFSSAERQAMVRARQLRRLSFLLLCASHLSNAAVLASVLEKMIESTKNYADHREVLRQVFVTFRAVLTRVEPQNLANFWSPMMAELIRVLTTHQRDHRLIAEALKTIDLLAVVCPQDFHAYRWIFLEPTDGGAPAAAEQGQYEALLRPLANPGLADPQRRRATDELLRSARLAADEAAAEGAGPLPHQPLLAVPDHTFEDDAALADMAAALLRTAAACDPNAIPVVEALRRGDVCDLGYCVRVLEGDLADMGGVAAAHFEPGDALAALAVALPSPQLDLRGYFAQSAVAPGDVAEILSPPSTAVGDRDDPQSGRVSPDTGRQGSGQVRTPPSYGRRGGSDASDHAGPAEESPRARAVLSASQAGPAG